MHVISYITFKCNHYKHGTYHMIQMQNKARRKKNARCEIGFHNVTNISTVMFHKALYLNKTIKNMQ